MSGSPLLSHTRGPKPPSFWRKQHSLFVILALTSVFLLYSRRSSPRSSESRRLAPSTSPLPVHHDGTIAYANTPVSRHRPPHAQFAPDPTASPLRPIISIVTATRNPRDIFLETVASLQHQSVQNWAWIVVDDGTDAADGKLLLRELANDARVTIIRNGGTAGIPTARNLGIEHVLSKEFVSPYIVFLDDDDLFELTALEKVIWMLESNPTWSLGGFPYIKFGEQNTTELRGLHSGEVNYFIGNFVPNTAVIRTSALLDSRCWYDAESFSGGGEDWDLWMCLAAAGYWGGSIPELLYWYRVNSASFRSERWGSLFVDGFLPLRAKIQQKHPTLALTGKFPTLRPRRSAQLEPVVWAPPYESNLDRTGKSIMFVLPWLYVGGADIGALHMIQLYAEAGYRVTVACTLYKNPAGLELRPLVLQHTHDVHILPSFLRACDFPRYLKHLIVSRGVEEVIISNSQYMYELLPALSDQLPHVKFVDYLHNEAYDGWKSGGYPNYSVISQRYLARTVTCSYYLRDWAIARGHDPARIGVVKLGIEISDFSPVNETTRARTKFDLLGVRPDTTVITILARLDPQKRSTMVPDIAAELQKLGAEDFVIVMLGDGDLATALNDRVDQLKVSHLVWPLGTVHEPQDYLAATDVFLLPSVSEGISIAVAEAMAMGLPIITARAGALPEQLGESLAPKGVIAPLAGILVNHTLDNTVDAMLYANELYKLLHDHQLRRHYGQIARRNVEKTFDWRLTLQGMFLEVQQASNLPERKRKGLPHPAAYYSSQTLLMEAAAETDFGINYP